MSLKLGNTNIAGTQVLYSTTGNNTDGAMTQAITTTQLNLKANDTDVVHKTGNEIISGFKTITSDLIRKMEGLDVTTAPLSDQYINWITPQDKNGVYAGYFGTAYYTNETLSSRLGVTRYVNGQPIYTEVGASIRKDGTKSSYAPPSDESDSIVTTAGINKSPNGYVKLGNGLIIQWGFVNIGSYNATGTTTFLTSFSSADSYSLAACGYRYEGNGQGELSFSYKSNTGFSWRSTASTNYYNETQYWIAIGY